MGQIANILEEILTELRCLNGPAAPAREIMSISQAAEYLGQSEHTLREWIRLRKIPFCKINGTIKLRKSRLDRWIERSEVAVME
jgi:excisionase family DNA binding protein